MVTAEELKKRRRRGEELTEEERAVLSKSAVEQRVKETGEREKRIGGLIGGGRGERGARRLVEREEAEAQRFGEEAEQAAPILEEAGAFEEVTPRRVSLLPSQPPADVAVTGPALAALSAISGERSILGILRDRGTFSGTLPPITTGEEAFPFPETPETLREAALRQISINSFNKGTSRAEKFGAFIEAIPAVGNRARAWAGGLIEDPKQNQEEALSHINRIKEDASTGQEKVRNGLEDPDFGLDNSRRMEEDIAALEGRIKLLILESAVLQANTDEVNTIQEQIFEAREKVNRYRTASEFGLTAQLTGTGRIIPTDEQMFFELKGGG